jgi:hypothetical protein
VLREVRGLYRDAIQQISDGEFGISQALGDVNPGWMSQHLEHIRFEAAERISMRVYGRRFKL